VFEEMISVFSLSVVEVAAPKVYSLALVSSRPEWNFI